MHASKEVRPDLDAPILVSYEIDGKFFQLTEEQIQAHTNKEEQIKKAVEEAKIAIAGDKFKKAQDSKHQVLKREYSQKAKRVIKLKKKRFEQYMWTTSSRLRPKPITDVKNHHNTKHAVLTLCIANDKRNFQVYNPFKFANFRVNELDELGPIIQKKKNTIVKDLMTSLGKRYERLKKIPKELGIQSALPAHVLDQAPSESSGRKRKHIELKLKVNVHGLECNRILPKGVPFVNIMVIKEPEYGIFFIDVFGDPAFQRWNGIHKVGVDSLVSYLVMASMIKT
ncbi:hypothetical protein Tco_1555942 [Tanacetum coccineum]